MKIYFSLEAKVYEDITASIENEFNRKRRYAAGNFQILIYFWKLLLPFKSSLGFVYIYFFHKIIRWISPIVFFGLWIASFFLVFGYFSKIIMLGGTTISLFLLINYIFQKRKISIFGKRFYYFLVMNLAILCGFFDYLKGVKSNVWERSERI